MATKRYYSPRISRFLVSVLYHEAKYRQIPMTSLVDCQLRQSLSDSKGWEIAEESKITESSA